MTTIAYNKGMLAVDSQVTHGHVNVPGPFKKLYIFPGLVFSYTGDVSVGTYILEFVKQYYDVLATNNMPAVDINFERFGKEGPPDTTFVLMTKTKCYTFGTEMVMQDITKGPACFGTGSSMAYAALVLGKTAKEAVAVACKLDTNSKLPVRWIEMKDL